MLHSRISAAGKRQKLRAIIADRRLARMPGAFSPLVARMIERDGFEGVYLSGHMLAASLGLPDIGLTTAPELASAAASFARATDLPVIADADTGFGSPLNAARTIQMLEDAGIAGCHIEDQAEPKRVGGAAGVRLMPQDIACRRIAGAISGRRDPGFLVIARTDALPVEGFDRALERARAYRATGADVIFVEGLRAADDVRRLIEADIGPVLVNINELAGLNLTSDELADLGVSIAIYPMALMRLALTPVEQALGELRRTGSMRSLASEMQDPKRLAELLDAASYPSPDAS